MTNANADNYTVIDLDRVSLSKSFNAAGEWVGETESRPYWDKVVLRVKGRHFPGYSLGFVPEGYAARQVTQGPIVPGPWAYASANCSVLDDRGGTRAELDRAKAEGRVVEAELGDYLMFDGSTFRIEPARKHDPVNIKLVAAEPPSPEWLDREQAQAERRLPNC